MILVTLGTQDKSFVRLLNQIEEEIKKGNIVDKVVVQAGNTKFTSENIEVLDFVEYEKFNKLIKSCDLLITHGGVGSIITGLKNNKKVIGVARLKKYHEHENDHQEQILKSFKEKNFILVCDELENLNEVLKKVDTFKPTKYISNTSGMRSAVKMYIDSF